jgi:hypothetical protein
MVVSPVVPEGAALAAAAVISRSQALILIRLEWLSIAPFPSWCRAAPPSIPGPGGARARCG